MHKPLRAQCDFYGPDSTWRFDDKKQIFSLQRSTLETEVMDALKIFKTALLVCLGLMRPLQFGTKLIIQDCSNIVSLGGCISAWRRPRHAHSVGLLKNHGEETVIFPTQVTQTFSLSHQTRRHNISRHSFAGFSAGTRHFSVLFQSCSN